MPRYLQAKEVLAGSPVPVPSPLIIKELSAAAQVLCLPCIDPRKSVQREQKPTLSSDVNHTDALPSNTSFWSNGVSMETCTGDFDSGLNQVREASE